MTYYQEGETRGRKVQQLFSKISRHYDLINDVQSFCLHRLWKRKVIQSLHLFQNCRVLDLACGSGDLAFRALNARKSAEVIGGDYTFQMLQVAMSRKTDEKPKGWIQLDGLNLPFREQSFDRIMIGYGLRNMADFEKAIREIARVLKPQGRVVILDFGKPPNPLIWALYGFFLRTIQPFLGWLFFRDSETYGYIYESLLKYPAQEGVRELLQKCGFKDVIYHNLAWGTMSLHAAKKD